MKEFTLGHMSIATVILAALIQTGCAASQVKNKIAADLNQIIEYQDCPTMCWELKQYVKTRLGQ